MHITIKNLLNIKEKVKVKFETNKNILKLPEIIAVSKTFKMDHIQHVLEQGHIHFGENKVQEATQKWLNLKGVNKSIKLHMLGKLQTNKVKQSLDLFDVIETIDREKLAKELAKNFNNNVKTRNFYIQINTGNEPQKSGLDPLQADSFIQYCINDLSLPIVGLMCIPPENEEPSIHFALLNKIASRNNLPELSMGMSNDYEDAIKFGATSVRIGSLFFGKRKV